MADKPKPLRSNRFGIISRPNVPYSQPLVPGLTKRYDTQAIGFRSSMSIRIEGPELRDSIRWDRNKQPRISPNIYDLMHLPPSEIIKRLEQD